MITDPFNPRTPGRSGRGGSTTEGYANFNPVYHGDARIDDLVTIISKSDSALNGQKARVTSFTKKMMYVQLVSTGEVLIRGASALVNPEAQRRHKMNAREPPTPPPPVQSKLDDATLRALMVRLIMHVDKSEQDPRGTLVTSVLSRVYDEVLVDFEKLKCGEK